MKNKLHHKAFLLVLFYSVLFHSSGLSQATQQNLSKTILFYDSSFWQTYNTCDVKNMGQYFTDDLEFYHDKGGYSKGLGDFIEKTKKNLCGTNNFRLKREAVPGSLVVFPLTTNDTIYGAILTGEHVFYVLENNKAPRLDGKAKFTHVWLLKDNVWKMARVLSYDHGPAIRQ